MITIGILGASSQVGASVAFFLQGFPEVKVKCFIRSSYSSVFFDMLGMEYAYIDTNNEQQLREQLGQLDVVLDFAYPAGQLDEILSRSKTNILQTLSVMKKGGAYFYMSSIMAYGMPDGQKWIEHYGLPRTSYSYIKRSIEKFTTRQGKKLGINVYNFRLGQVHGFLQSVNSSFRKKLTETNIALVDGNPDDKVNVIFIHPLCEAIVRCSKGVHPPGLYTLVSSPQWTLQQLYEYYLDYYKLSGRLLFRPSDIKKRRKSLFRVAIELARPYRALLETYLLMRIPSLFTSIKGSFRMSELQQQVDSAAGKMEYIDFNLLGTPPFQMIGGLAVDPVQTLSIEKEREGFYNAIIAGKHV